jgi:hypothetical protein
MALTEKQADALANELQLMGVDAGVYTDYSGRGMYGSTVTGIILDDQSELTDLGIAAAQLGIGREDVPRRTDNLGRRIIVY